MSFQNVQDLSLSGFDKEMRDIALEAGEYGWVGRVSQKNHLILRCPNGSETMSIARKAHRARSEKNARAALDRWIRDHAPEPEPTVKSETGPIERPLKTVELLQGRGIAIPTPALGAARITPAQWVEAATPGGFSCEHCDRTFDSQRSLGSHQRAHTLEYWPCPLCERPTTYLGKHLRMRHGLTDKDAGVLEDTVRANAKPVPKPTPEEAAESAATPPTAPSAASAESADEAPDPVTADRIDALETEVRALRSLVEDANARAALVRDALSA